MWFSHYSLYLSLISTHVVAINHHGQPPWLATWVATPWLPRGSPVAPGCNIGEDVWELFCTEHNIGRDGRRFRAPRLGRQGGAPWSSRLPWGTARLR